MINSGSTLQKWAKQTTVRICPALVFIPAEYFFIYSFRMCWRQSPNKLMGVSRQRNTVWHAILVFAMFCMYLYWALWFVERLERLYHEPIHVRAITAGLFILGVTEECETLVFYNNRINTFKRPRCNLSRETLDKLELKSRIALIFAFVVHQLDYSVKKMKLYYENISKYLFCSFNIRSNYFHTFFVYRVSSNINPLLRMCLFDW